MAAHHPPTCRFHGSMMGCRNGNECVYSHSNPNSVPLCTWANSCRYGSQCKYRHVHYPISSATCSVTPTPKLINQTNIDHAEKAPTVASTISPIHQNQYNGPQWSVHSRLWPCVIKNDPIQIQDSIWYSTDYDEGEKGMIEFCLKTNKTKSIVKYPEHIKPKIHSMCKCNNKIYLIDNTNSWSDGQIIEFDPTIKQFIKKIQFETLDGMQSVVVVNNCIHIYIYNYNGSQYSSNVWIYNTSKNVIQKINGNISREHVLCGCLSNYNNRLIQFGGLNTRLQPVTEFLLGVNNIDIVTCYIHECKSKLKLLRRIPSDVIDVIAVFYCDKYEYHWSKIDCFELMHPMHQFGYVVYNDFVITFGGLVEGFGDEIYILDTADRQRGWILSDVRCPEKTRYTAILTSYGDVHLFNHKAHYSLQLSSILAFKDH